MRFLGSAALIVMLATPALAQDVSPAPATDTANDAVTLRTHEDVLVAETLEVLSKESRKVADKKFWLVSAALNSAMLMDTWSTFHVIGRCSDCREANPYVAPFVKRGATVTFAAGQAFDIGVMALSKKMKASNKPQIRKIWWVLPVALTTGHIIAYRHNMKLVR